LSAERTARASLALALLGGWALLLCFQGWTLAESSGRRVGFWPDQGAAGLAVRQVTAGLPAARAGLRPGDQVVALDGRPVRTVGAYDQAAMGFRPGKPVRFGVRRGAALHQLTVIPGTPFQGFRFTFRAITALGFLGVALLALLQGSRDLRARLLLLFSAAAAFELVLPTGQIGFPWLGAVVLCAFYLLTGLQIGLELHLAALIPVRHAWLCRAPWAIPLFYVLGLGLGLGAAATYAAEEVFGRRLFPWSSGQAEAVLVQLGVPFWALGVVLLLASQALRHPQPQGRHQAALVLSGVLPWGLFVIGTALHAAAGRPVPDWFSAFEPVALLCYPAAFFAAIFRYHLFDVELVVRRSLIYTALTGSLVLVFYATLGAGGALFSELIGEQSSVWAISAATLLLGLAVSPLHQALHRLIDRRFFPERQALRRELAALAGELPAFGKLPLMGRHLVARLCTIFEARAAALFTTSPETGVLTPLAATLPALTTRDGQPDTPFLSVDDPGLELLRRAERPLPAAQVLARSPALTERLALLDPALLVPLLDQERLAGFLAVGRKEGRRAYPAEELDLLQLLGRHVATVFENARLFQSATYEGLTGLLRREAVLEQLARELDRALRYGRPLTVAMADLDHFKEINDCYGHLVGDAFLKRIGQMAASGLRSTDWLGRYGGEEFLLVLPETGLEGAAAVAEKIRSLVQGTAMPMEDGSLARVTISIGLAEVSELVSRADRPPTARDLIAAADRALYEAKNGGRNRVYPLVA
jgi:diguanylate cyclase (GGDEF)-like protein